MKQFRLIIAVCFISILACAQVQQKESSVKAEAPTTINYTTEVVVPELNIPWGMAFLPDGAILITEKKGDLIHFKDGKKTEINGLPDIYVRGQGGLMDIILHPNYKDNGWIYFSYASSKGEGIGLSSCVNIATEAGYRLSLNSTKQRGSCFSLLVPRHLSSA